MRLALHLTLPLPSRFEPSVRLMVDGTAWTRWLSGDSSCDSWVWEKRKILLTRQPVGTPVGTTTVTVVMSANRVNLGRFSSRCCAFRCTHTRADPFQLLCIRLGLPLTLSLPLRLEPSARLTVGFPPRALWLARIFICRKKKCAGVVGTRTD